MKWQPIETAPKDGSKFLVLWGDSIDIARYDDDHQVENPQPFWSFVSFCDVKSRGSQPTHWMPLPSSKLNDEEELVCSCCGATEGVVVTCQGCAQ